ncbi:hypothetical protein Aduo_005989 [Ancylostoma duodenale]
MDSVREPLGGGTRTKYLEARAQPRQESRWAKDRINKIVDPRRGGKDNSGEQYGKGEPQIRCYKCNGRGHLARDCKKPKMGQGRAMGLQSVPITSQNGSGEKLRGDGQVNGKQTSPFGDKCGTEVIVFGRVRNALLDTGSEISIMPVDVLNQIRRDGHTVREFPVDRSKRILDASGNLMKFSAVVEVPLREKDKEEVIVKMHVTKQPGQTLVIGTNALPALRYTLVRGREEPATKGDPAGREAGSEEGKGVRRRNEGNLEKMREPNGEKAVVCKRVYVASGELKWISLRGTIGRPERLLHSEMECIKSGLCSVNEARSLGSPIVEYGRGTNHLEGRCGGRTVGTR